MHGAVPLDTRLRIYWMPWFHSLRCQEEPVCGQRTARHTTDVIVGGFQSALDRGPKAWNQLSASVRHMDCVATFKRHLKYCLLKRAVCRHSCINFI